MKNTRRYFLKKISIVLFFILVNPSKVLASDISYWKEGQRKAADFELDGISKNNLKAKKLSLKDFRDYWIVLYFYPEDLTSGCTIEAKEFNRKINDFNAINTKVIGISRDTLESHLTFCNKESLNFILLSDPDGEVSLKYESWGEIYSKRNTYIIDPEGNIRERWIDVSPKGHAINVYNHLLKLQQESMKVS